MADVTQFLFQGATPVNAPTGSDSSTNFPLWLQQSSFNVGQAAVQAASQPYTPFPGQLVASPSPTTQQAWDTAESNVGNYQPALQQAGALTASAGTPVSASDISGYLNPFTQNVTGALAQLAGQNLTNTLLPGVNDTFTKAGQFGSSQDSEFNNRAVRDTQQSLLNAQSQALQQGYQGALSAAQAQKGQQLAAGAQTGQLGALTQQLGAADVSQLAGAGSAQDTLAQQNINANLNAFQQQQQWPYQNIGFASNVIHGLPVGTTTQTASATPAAAVGASPLATGIGTLGLANSLGLREGGHVGGALSRAINDNRRGALGRAVPLKRAA